MAASPITPRRIGPTISIPSPPTQIDFPCKQIAEPSQFFLVAQRYHLY